MIAGSRYDLGALLVECRRSSNSPSRSGTGRAGLRDEAIMATQAGHAGLAYLDYNATAPLRPKALEAVLDALQSVGNASSIHVPGRDAASRVDTARRQLADL